MSQTCPHCGCALTPPALREGWCENCGKRLPSYVTTSATSGPGEAKAGSPAVRKRAVSTADAFAWGTVRAGLGQMLLGFVLLDLGFLSIMALVLAAVATPPQPRAVMGGQGDVLLFALSVGSSYALILGCGLVLVGMLLCRAAPEGSSARGFGIAMALCIVLGLLIVLGATLASLSGAVTAVNALSIALLIVFVGLALCWILFLRGVAVSFANTILARSMVVFLVVCFISLGANLMLSFAGQDVPWHLLPGMAKDSFALGWLGFHCVVALGAQVLAFLTSRTLIRGVVG